MSRTHYPYSDYPVLPAAGKSLTQTVICAALEIPIFERDAAIPRLFIGLEFAVAAEDLKAAYTIARRLDDMGALCPDESTPDPFVAYEALSRALVDSLSRYTRWDWLVALLRPERIASFAAFCDFQSGPGTFREVLLPKLYAAVRTWPPSATKDAVESLLRDGNALFALP